MEGSESNGGKSLNGCFLKDFSQFWSNIQIRADMSWVRTIMITSAKRKEGVTFLLYHLARVIAEQEKKNILLVDCNTNNPCLHKIFYLPPDEGFIDICRGKLAWEDCLKDTAVPGIQLIPFGNYKGYQALPADTATVPVFFEEIRAHYDLILVDAPSIHQSPYPGVLGKYTDGVILALLSGSTKREVAQRALSKITHLKDKLLGIVLNRKKYYIPSFLYGVLK
jgi:Mrp family chromosome partitioning ATPase